MKATKAILLKCSTRRHTSTTIDGIEFTFQNMTEREKSEFERSILNKKGGVNVDARKRLLVYTLVDEDQNTMLDMSDLKSLDDLDGQLVQKLFEVASKHCGFGDDEIDELEKNSEMIHGGGLHIA